jgi:hypothetical protein
MFMDNTFKDARLDDEPTLLTTTRAMLVVNDDRGRIENYVEPWSSDTSPNGEATFPFKLYDILEDASSEGFEHIVSWMPNGNGFKMHDREQFKKSIIARYFNQIHYKSFIRQLNLYSFNRKERGSYFHDFFVRGERFLCGLMERSKIKNRGAAADVFNKSVLLLGGKKACSSPAVLIKKNEHEEKQVFPADPQGCKIDYFAPNYDDGWRMERASLKGAGDFELDPILVTDGLFAPPVLQTRITCCINPDLANDIIAIFC